jgi:hypothetical protein
MMRRSSRRCHRRSSIPIQPIHREAVATAIAAFRAGKPLLDIHDPLVLSEPRQQWRWGALYLIGAATVFTAMPLGFAVILVPSADSRK